ncbi:NAD(P)-dependent oxidoreductase [Magnetospira sp. QH-2]|uniref:NAD(P)-dependent oxidoreductase n=1 Tax=Magnetospira sp. (strain QH-2) TaxID=1288970 RepID=UPI0003E81168|nr:NAD(P)-dependent oxidoreductase [Magnetospira sp. QH-2]CCQ73792.1 Tartronate semialdehyde reductase [Magnetospira sp. QH-2]
MSMVTFIGLGVMGYPMAGHLSLSGHEVTVFNRTTAKAEKWIAEYDGDMAQTPREAVMDADVVCICVGNDDDLRSVLQGEDGVLTGLDKGAIIVDHSTTSAAVARDMAAEAMEKGVGFLDAPVSGGQIGAENGTLTVMVGGSETDFAKVDGVISAYSRAVTLMGPVGAGQMTKMVNQITITGLLQGLSEALNFAQKAGLDGEKVVEVISKGAAQSWQMDNRSHTMLDDKFEFGFAVDLLRKDLGICMDEARRNGARLPVTALVDQFYAQLQEQGGGRWDTSSLIRLLRG